MAFVGRWYSGIPQRYTIGVEEELMLLDPAHFSLVQSSEKVLRRLPDGLSAHVSPETPELATLRGQLARELSAMGLRAASAGIYPLAYAGETRVSGSVRYRVVADSMRALARREPTLALHCTLACLTPRTRSGCSTAFAARCYCCSRRRPNRRFARGGTAGLPPCAP